MATDVTIFEDASGGKAVSNTGGKTILMVKIFTRKCLILHLLKKLLLLT